MDSKPEISILIPVFNYNILPFVESLHQQCVSANIIFEILCYDDCSTDKNLSEQNKKINILSHTKYHILDTNIGRAAIRNRLAASAKYFFLILLDCDNMPADQFFIKKYIANIGKAPVIIGGTSYDGIQTKKYQSLRILYGRKREQISAAKRKSSPYESFTLNNLFIEKLTYLKYQLDEKLTHYGHEDTVFGILLKKAKVNIIHIDNPVLHLGIDSNEDFLKKTRQGVRNLAYLYQSKQIGKELKLIQYYWWIRLTGLLSFFYLFYKLTHKVFRKNLLSNKPSLFAFDLYKLYWFAKEMRKKQAR